MLHGSGNCSKSVKVCFIISDKCCALGGMEGRLGSLGSVAVLTQGFRVWHGLATLIIVMVYHGTQ